MDIALVLMATALMGSYGQERSSTTGPLHSLEFLVGRWTGREEGTPGEGHGERTYELIMNGVYLVGKNRSTYPPQERNPEGEVHQDWQIFSHDRGNDRLALRQFHIEGFVIHYLLQDPTPDSEALVFTSTSIENFEGRARYTLLPLGEDQFEETFEVAASGEDFRTLLRNRWTRAGK